MLIAGPENYGTPMYESTNFRLLFFFADNLVLVAAVERHVGGSRRQVRPAGGYLYIQGPTAGAGCYTYPWISDYVVPAEKVEGYYTR